MREIVLTDQHLQEFVEELSKASETALSEQMIRWLISAEESPVLNTFVRKQAWADERKRLSPELVQAVEEMNSWSYSTRRTFYAHGTVPERSLSAAGVFRQLREVMRQVHAPGDVYNMPAFTSTEAFWGQLNVAVEEEEFI